MLECPPKAKLRRARDRRRELKRERHRRHRERVRAHRFTVTIELGEREIDWLVSVRWISPQEADSGDRKAIGERIAAGLAASARG
jgi:hypothetical protein